MISNISLFAQLLGKVALYTGVGPGIVIAILFEKFRGRAVSPLRNRALATSIRATSPPRKEQRAA
jgi:hypothetical protein